MKKIVAVSLLVSILSLMLSSCSLLDLFKKDEEVSNNDSTDDSQIVCQDGEVYRPDHLPEGYTGGYPQGGLPDGSIDDAVAYWVETYDECVEAIKLLESHGTYVYGEPLISYSGDIFDVKYRFIMHEMKCDKIEFGADPFDRYCYEVYVTCYVFFEDVEIDDFAYSLVSKYHPYVLGSYWALSPDQRDEMIVCDDDNCSLEHFSYKWVEYYDEPTKPGVGHYAILHNGEPFQITFCAYNIDNYRLSDDVMEAVVTSIVLWDNIEK